MREKDLTWSLIPLSYDYILRYGFFKVRNFEDNFSPRGYSSKNSKNFSFLITHIWCHSIQLDRDELMMSCIWHDYRWFSRDLYNTEDLPLSKDPNELWERRAHRGESGISNKIFSLLVSYLSDIIESFKIFEVKMKFFWNLVRGGKNVKM